MWDGNGTNFAHAIVKNAMKVNGKNWVLLTNDYVWGHNTSKATRAMVEANGGKIVDELLVPQNTRDFSSYLLKLQQIKPDVVAAAVGGDDIKALRQQVVQLEAATRRMAWINNQQDWPDVYGLGPGRDLRRVRHHLVLPARPAGREGVRRRVPEAVSRAWRSRCRATSTTTATWRRASCCARRATPARTNNIAVIKELEGLQDDGARPHAALRRLHEPGHAPVQQTIYMASYNDTAGGEGRHLQDPGAGAAEGRRGQGRAGACKLETYEATPSYEQ